MVQITKPRFPTCQEKHSMAMEQHLPHPRGRVLVVDDDATIRALLTDFLQHQGFDAQAVADGSSALAVFRTQHLDLILVDFQMPGMTGLAVATEVRKSHSDIPIALITGSLHTVDPSTIVQARINRTFLKPFDLNELSAWISSLGL